jgi:hypothetical protein
MKNFFLRFIPLTIIQSAALSVFISMYFLDAGIRSQEKGLIILVGVWFVLFVGLLTICYFLLFKNKRLEISSKEFISLVILCLGVGILLSLIVPLPKPKTPANWQVIEITPIADKFQDTRIGKILLEEIKMDGNPISFDEWKEVPGWQRTPFGIESDAGSGISILLQRKGPIEKNVGLLFGSGPNYGTANIRLGWNQQIIDTYRAEGESELPIEFPAPSELMWSTIYFLGLCVTIFVLLFFLAFVFLPQQKIKRISDLMDSLSRSVLFWILFSFLLGYAFFFFKPVFLNSSNIMKIENNLPTIYPIGNDLHLILNSSKAVAAGESPYVGANKYPPFASVFFLPLTRLNIREAFQILSLTNFFFFIFISLGFPIWVMKKRKLDDFAWIIFVSGLFSYGFHFEIERGQFNLVAIGLVFMAIALFHKAPKYQWLAFVLFCIGVQLKIYPAIFVVFFTRNWENWKQNILRWVLLGISNAILLMVLGWDVLKDFLSMMTNVVSGLGDTRWAVSHSINGFLAFIRSYFPMQSEAARGLQIVIYLLVIGFIVICLYQAIKRKMVLDPYLMFACILGALMFPSLSNDYTLAMLIGPAILYFAKINTLLTTSEIESGKIPWVVVITLVSALAFASTFYSYFVKEIVLQNQFPALLILLGCAAWLSMLDYRQTNNQKST